jgi:hypothetical protein
MGSTLDFVWRRGTRSIILGTVLLALFTFLWFTVGARGRDTTTRSIEVPSGVIARQGTIAYTVTLPMMMRDYPPPPPIFGVHMHSINNGSGLAQAVEAGVYWVNFGGFYWPSIEPARTNPPTYHWEVVDEQSLINASESGLTVVARVHHAPPWAREDPGHNGSRIAQDHFDEFAQFLTGLVNRYKGPPYNVKYWELDSEVDVDPSLHDGAGQVIFWCWGDESDDYYGGGYFAEMLKSAYPAIKAADPSAKVVIGGLLLDCDPRNPPPNAAANCKPSLFLEGILRGGGGPYFDYVSFHAYTYYCGEQGRMCNAGWTGGDENVQSTAVLEKGSFLREVLQTYGYGEKGLMNMEAALMCSADTEEECLGTSVMETQAMYIPRAYAEAFALDLAAQAWFTMKEPVWRYTGLVNADLTPKPVYNAYKAATSFLSDVQYVGLETVYSCVEGYTLRKQDHSTYVDVVWSADGSTCSISLPGGAAAYDKYGNLVASSGTIQVDYSPVYITRP